MDFGRAVATCFRKYVTFTGRASRSEFWWFFLFTALVQLCAAILDSAVMGTNKGTWKPFTTIQGAVVFLPSLAVWVRRFHDINFSGWIPFGMLVGGVAFIAAIPSFGPFLIMWGIVFIYFLSVGGDDGDNRFGPDPLASTEPAQTPDSPNIT